MHWLEGSFDSFGQQMRKVLVVIKEEVECLLWGYFEVLGDGDGHKL